MFHTDPRQNQKACAVGQKGHVTVGGSAIPPRSWVSYFQMSGALARTRHAITLAMRFHQIPQVLNRLFITQIVILLHQTVEHQLFRRAPHLHNPVG